MKKYLYSLIVLVLFSLTGKLAAATLEFIPASAVYTLSFDLKRISELPAVKENISSEHQKVLSLLEEAGTTRLTIVGDSKWNAALVGFSCSQDDFMSLLARNGVQTEMMEVNGFAFYKVNHWKLEQIPAEQKPVFTFIAPNMLAAMEQGKIASVVKALDKTEKIQAGKEVVWCFADPRRIKVPEMPQVKEMVKMFRSYSRILLKMDLLKDGDFLLELGAVCKDQQRADFAAFMLPAGMVMVLNYLCSSDAELCNQLAGMVTPGVSGNTAYARLKLTPELLPRMGKAIQASSQKIREQLPASKGNSF